VKKDESIPSRYADFIRTSNLPYVKDSFVLYSAPLNSLALRKDWFDEKKIIRRTGRNLNCVFIVHIVSIKKIALFLKVIMERELKLILEIN
jgi:hypothetical protein